MHTLSRALNIAIGYLAASIVAGTVALIGLMIPIVGAELLAPQALGQLAVPIAVASIVSGTTALLPTLPVGVYAERRGIRALAWYVRAGVGIGIAALVLYILASEIASRSVSNANKDDVWFLATLAASVLVAGFCSGATYWAIAGRHAGPGAVPPSVSNDNQKA